MIIVLDIDPSTIKACSLKGWNVLTNLVIEKSRFDPQSWSRSIRRPAQTKPADGDVHYSIQF